MSLRACVVVPAHNEEDLIAACIEALAAQQGVTRAEYEVLLVLDRCTDATEQRAREAAHDLNLRVLAANGAGVGHARRTGMDAAAHRLPPDGLIATTDADSTPAPDWLRAQLDAVANGAHAIGGRIEVGAHDLPAAALVRREADASRRRAALRGAGAREHHQFSGASLAVTAATYARVGGLDPREALEDEGFERVLHRHGIPIERLAAVRVTTSARRVGRAPRGLAVDLRRNGWLAERNYDASEFSLDRLLAAKTRSVSVILPTREVAGTLGHILDAIASLDPLVDEVLVVDASTDGTAELARARGIRVVPQPESGQGRRDVARPRGQHAASSSPTSTRTPRTSPTPSCAACSARCSPPTAEFVKGHFRRPLRVGDTTHPEGGGRVTELLARPYLNLHFPALAGFRQPLAGEIAATRELLESLPFPAGYGVEIAMLIDVYERIGLERMAQVDLGTRQNRHQSLKSLSRMALEVLAAAERRVHARQHRPRPAARPDARRLRAARSAHR